MASTTRLPPLLGDPHVRKTTVGAKTSQYQVENRTTTKPPQHHHQHQPARDLFHMRYFRFSCKDIDETIDFYTTLGMTVDYDGEQEAVLAPQPPPPPSQPSQSHYAGRNRPTYMPATASHGFPRTADGLDTADPKLNGALRKDTYKSEFGVTGFNKGKQAETAVMNSRVLVLSHGVESAITYSNGSGSYDKIQLIFEKDQASQVDHNKDSKDPLLDMQDLQQDSHSQTRLQARGDHSTPEPLHSYEYLVIYIHFINRIVKRVSAKGFEIIMPPTEFETTKVCILKDPNGIEVRLYDMTDAQLNESSSKKSWFSRPAYYVVPTSTADDTALWYEALFQTRTPRLAAGKGGKEKIDPITGREIAPNDPSHTKSLRKAGPAGTVRQAISKVQGFRIVDMDEFIVGLSNTVFYWLGNNLRTSACTLCLTEVCNADTGEVITKYDKDRSQLIGIGFEVPNLDAVINKLNFETKDRLEWITSRYRMEGVGIVAKFKDKYNGYALELLCTKTGDNNSSKLAGITKQPYEVTTSHKTSAGGAQPPTAVTNRTWADPQTSKSHVATQQVAEVSHPTPVYTINLNHLKGHVRSLSMDAICRPKPTVDQWTVELQLPPLQTVPHHVDFPGNQTNTKRKYAKRSPLVGNDYPAIASSVSSNLSSNEMIQNNFGENDSTNGLDQSNCSSIASITDKQSAVIPEIGPRKNFVVTPPSKSKSREAQLRDLFAARLKSGSAVF
ncbi:hypothetical protein BASA61_001116 [Batrachochytrium salamandrivorans]|nr:hypothetical protein BASA61_001116 [Batrachochytrium salamandrivorans]KAH9275013.1 hypothetical protein BASA83_002726 [Batrachochytrium salamandrivorans]